MIDETSAGNLPRTQGSQIKFILALLCWLPFGGIAFAQLLSIALGSYDPVNDDYLPTQLLPYYWIFLVGEVVISLSGMTWVLSATITDERLTYRILLCRSIICWSVQVLVWALFGVIAVTH